MKRLTAVLLAMTLLCGCAAPAVPGQTVVTEPSPFETEPTTSETAPLTQAAQDPPSPAPSFPPEESLRLMDIPPLPSFTVLQPEAPGIQEERCAEAVIDYSNAAEGYVMVQYTADTQARLKVLVNGPGTTYSYNLPKQEWTVFPLSDGNGYYTIGVYLNVSGTKYATVMSAGFQVTLTDEFAPFLRPNQYVNYVDAPNTVALGALLTMGLDHPLEKVAAVYDHVIHNFTYDNEKAATVKSGYLPDLDTVLEQKKGICFDYAALMTAMLRSQQVPCKLVVGYAGSVYHAWISVWTEENGWIDGAIFFDGQVWKRMDPTFASSGEGDPDIMNFIENGEYRVRYLY